MKMVIFRSYVSLPEGISSYIPSVSRKTHGNCSPRPLVLFFSIHGSLHCSLHSQLDDVFHPGPSHMLHGAGIFTYIWMIFWANAGSHIPAPWFAYGLIHLAPTCQIGQVHIGFASDEHCSTLRDAQARQVSTYPLDALIR